MKKVLLSIALLSIGYSAFAADVDRPVYRDHGVYVYGYGAAGYAYDSQNSSNKFDHYGNGGIVGSGYQFSQNFALEMEVGYFKGNSGSGVDKVYQPALVAKGIIPLMGDFNLFGKVGIADNMYRYSDDNTADKNKLRPLVGLGFGYNISQAFEVDAIFQTTMSHETVDGNNKAWLGNGFIGVGVTVHF